MTVLETSSPPARARLHITPFTSDLLDRILPASLRTHASGISFHTLETFPERGFGFIDLPMAEAQSLKKKLNGATLKGMKIRIEDAKPDQKRKPGDNPPESDERSRKAAKRSKISRVQGVLPGHELEPGRSVQRGWTSGESATLRSKQRPSQSKEATSNTIGSSPFGKMQFKTNLPPSSRAAQMEIEAQRTSKEKKSRKKKSDKSYIQEFTKSTRLNIPALRDGATVRAVSYEDGKGWVDEDGDIVQHEHESARRNRKSQEQSVRTSHLVASVDTLDDGPLDDAPDASSSELENPSSPGKTTSSEEQSTASGTEEDDASECGSDEVSSASSEHLEEASLRVVHPLEALFKRSAAGASHTDEPKPPATDTTFSFFDAPMGDDDDDDEGEPTNGVGETPQTPHTTRDLDGRAVRSAAPTPDTAGVGRQPFYSAAVEFNDFGDDAVASHALVDGDTAGGSTGGEPAESDFRKWFYENRGDLNRKWKACRREELKVKKKRESRRLNRKIA